jgi:conjugative relaxase-like TrwC/TraI family protein
VLRVVGLTDRTGRYYLADLAEELGATVLAGERPDLGRSVGRWAGSGASCLGLTGPVDAGAFEAVLGGRHPFAGYPLRSRTSSIVAYDLTFAAPKSVSVLFGLGDATSARVVLEAHRSAVADALGYVSRRGAAVRRGSGDERSLVPVDGIIVAAFVHGVSRAMDPHLHTHAVVANVAHGEDGRWTALDARGLYAHARAAGALYDAQLRRALTEGLDVSWSARKSGAYEVAAVDPLLIGALSGRQSEIRAYLLAGGQAGTDSSGTMAVSHRAHSAAWAATRDEKSPRTRDALRLLWRVRAAGVGLTERALAIAGAPARALAGPAGTGVVGTVDGVDALDEYRFAASLRAGTPHAAATRRDVVAAWAGAVRAGATVHSVERCASMVAEWGSGIGVGEESRPLRAVLPSQEVLRPLGPRPADPDALAVWRSAAAAIERYRARWAVTEGRGSGRDRGDGIDGREQAAFRSSPAMLATMPARQLAEHLAVARQVAEVRRRLGRATERQAPVPERAVGRG